jgi:hypothetical protein
LQEELTLQETAQALLGKREHQLESFWAEAPSKGRWAHVTNKTFCMKWDPEWRHEQWWFNAFTVDPAKLGHYLQIVWEAGTPQPVLSCKLENKSVGTTPCVLVYIGVHV